MKAIYNAERNELNELSELPKPDKYIAPLDHGTGRGRPNMGYWAEKEKYDAHTLTLQTIPCSEECRSIWKDGQVVEEGKDYEIKSCKVLKTYGSGEEEYMSYAYPIKQDNTNEDEQDTHWLNIVRKLLPAYEHTILPFGLAEDIADLKQFYTITKRKP